MGECADCNRIIEAEDDRRLSQHKIASRRSLLNAPLGIRDLEKIARLQVHKDCQKDFRKLPDASVVGIYIVVEELTAVSDFLLQLRDPILQAQEGFIGL